MSGLEDKPFIEGDFYQVKSSSGGRPKTEYRGPIYSVSYPETANDMVEWQVWLNLGYQVDFSFKNIEDSTFTLRVMGDIPEDVQDRLRQVGVGVELYRERNVTGREFGYDKSNS